MPQRTEDLSVVRDEARTRLIAEVESIITAVMPDATVMELPSAISKESIAVTAFDASDTRSAQQLIEDLGTQLRSAGWAIDDREKDGEEPALTAAKPGIGGGTFGVQSAAISFAGLVDRE
ncbi:hypothetical protein ACQUSR_19125 [Streptomyces sp. P1-3]|uniref:hypothetical protein n=1 Tax=Streptomyces sp. P1-3 TaxID=3421658 RepID=UPI003D3687AF